MSREGGPFIPSQHFPSSAPPGAQLFGIDAKRAPKYEDHSPVSTRVPPNKITT